MIVDRKKKLVVICGVSLVLATILMVVVYRREPQTELFPPVPKATVDLNSPAEQTVPTVSPDVSVPAQNTVAPTAPSVAKKSVQSTVAPTAPPILSGPAQKEKQSRLLFSDALDGPDRIVTNEFVYWSKSTCPYASDKWDMTSGTLLIKNGAGYSGIPTREQSSVCDSAATNNSSIFRLNTKDFSFGNVITSMDFMMSQHGGGGAPVNNYDGVHMWVRYQSQYALYSVTISRWDGVIVIKKKIPTDIAHCTEPANDGCYYNLSKETKRPDLASGGAWHHVDIVTNDDSSRVVHITLKIDGQVVFDVDDNNTYGPSYHEGSVGVRGDNTEFYFKNFTVRSD